MTAFRFAPVLRRKRALPQIPWYLAVPGLAFVTAFVFAPILAGSYYAFTNWDGVTSADWVGFDNFSEIFKDNTTSGALVHTLLIAGVFFVSVNVIGLALAVALNRTLKSRNLLRAVFFLPVVMSPLAVSFIWQYIFDADGGLNRLLRSIGLDSWAKPWLAEPDWAIWAVLIVLIWQYSGLMMVIYLAGLQGISDELLEASAVDGAGPWTRFRRVVFPLLAPAFTICATLSMIFGLRVFDQVMALTDGGPGNATETLATQVYKQTFVLGKFGYGAANALILTLLVSAIVVMQLIVLRRREARM